MHESEIVSGSRASKSSAETMARRCDKLFEALGSATITLLSQGRVFRWQIVRKLGITNMFTYI
jgi:hypothetical protein